MDATTRIVQNSYVGYSDSQGGMIRLNRRGEIVTSEFVFQAALDGRLFIGLAGTVTTPITWTATATIDITKPVFFLSVPSGTTVIPVAADLYMEAYGLNAQFETNMVVGTGGSRTSGGTLVTPVNMRSDAPVASACSFYAGGASIVTVGSTGNLVELFHDGAQFAITKTTASATASVNDQVKWGWKLMDSFAPPVAVGASQIAMHQGSQAGTGFARLIWVEVPTVSAT